MTPLGQVDGFRVRVSVRVDVRIMAPLGQVDGFVDANFGEELSEQGQRTKMQKNLLTSLRQLDSLNRDMGEVHTMLEPLP